MKQNEIEVMTEELKNVMLEHIRFSFNNRFHRFYKGNELVPYDAFYEIDHMVDPKSVGKNKLLVEIYFTVKDEDGKCYISESTNAFVMMHGYFLLEAKWGETVIKDVKYKVKQ